VIERILANGGKRYLVLGWHPNRQANEQLQVKGDLAVPLHRALNRKDASAFGAE